MVSELYFHRKKQFLIYNKCQNKIASSKIPLKQEEPKKKCSNIQYHSLQDVTILYEHVP